MGEKKAKKTEKELLEYLRSAGWMEDEDAYAVYMQIVEENPDKTVKHIRDLCYTYMGKMLAKSFDKNVCVFLIQHLLIESDKYIVHSILDLLADLTIPEDIDISPIIECSQSDKWLIRHSALDALGACNTQKSREALRFYINQDDEKKYAYEIGYANASMGRIGTEEDIPFLEKHINSRKRDIKLTARAAIEKIKTGKYSFDQKGMTPYGLRK